MIINDLIPKNNIVKCCIAVNEKNIIINFVTNY